jgi:uncharacterized RDD family membrane protein YckC
MKDPENLLDEFEKEIKANTALTGSGESYYPALIDRVHAIFIDLFFILLLSVIISLVLDKFTDPPAWVRVVLFLSLWGLYEPVMTVYACTLGQRLKKIRVRRDDDLSRRIRLFPSFVRYLLKFYLGGLSFLAIGFNEKKRAIHDFASGSVVIKHGKEYPVRINRLRAV